MGSEDDVKEVKIGARLCPDVKKGLIDLLREYSDVFAIEDIKNEKPCVDFKCWKQFWKNKECSQDVICDVLT